MASQQKQPTVVLGVEALEARELLSTSPSLIPSETFDGAVTRGLPAGWNIWNNQGPFAVGASRGYAGSDGLVSTGATTQNARTWYNASQPASVQVSARVLGTSLLPFQVLARGTNLAGPTPSYYAVSLERGVAVRLQRVVNGVATTLGEIRSDSYLANTWFKVSLTLYSRGLKVQVQRLDNNQYLDSKGEWVSTGAFALERTDSSSSALLGGGQAGLMRPARNGESVSTDDFQVRALDSQGRPAGVLYQQTFESTAAGAIPTGWSQWTDQGPVAVSSARAWNGPRSLALSGASTLESRAWQQALGPADVKASAAVWLDSLIPARVFARGSNLGGGQASYYSVTLERGLGVKLQRIVNGQAATLGSVRSAAFTSNLWVRATLQVQGSRLQAVVRRLDTNQYLTRSGTWQTTPASALDLTDTSASALKGQGFVGLARGSGSSGTLYFDDFAVGSATTTAPTLQVSLSGLANGATISTPTTVTANVTGTGSVDRVEFYLDNVLQSTDRVGPYSFVVDPARLTSGQHTLRTVAFEKSGASFQASRTFTRAATIGPVIPRHYSHIRLAQLAYAGTPLGDFEQRLLRNSIDLVIPWKGYLNDIQAVAPSTPQLVYTNVSSLYLTSLVDWLNYADANGFRREDAFYHVSRATPFEGDSASSQPVTWFWGVYQTGGTPDPSDYTFQSHTNTAAVPFGGVGTAMHVGYPDRFREVNFNLSLGARNGWTTTLEYPTRVNSDGVPAAWATLPLLADGTAGMTRGGKIVFDPPSNWVPASVNGSQRLYYVRFRTTRGGTAPVANTILGRDYVGANGRTRGTIPAFDATADANHDGYLNGAEYVHRRSGFDARFFYESRAFLSFYGQQRPATNPSKASVRQWAVDYQKRLLATNRLADGLYLDNSSGILQLPSVQPLESTANYARDYGEMLRQIGLGIAPRYIFANTAGGGSTSRPVVANVAGYYEEFAIRPLAHNYNNFEFLASTIADRARVKSPSPYAVLDVLPRNGAPTDARTQLAALAYYYLLADPDRTFLNLFGGSEPSTTWARHWAQAATYNVGQPTGTWTRFATGADPANRALTYRVYKRNYSNAVVLYKPLSSNTQSANGTLSNTTATTHALGGTFRPLLANGTLGAPVTTVTLRNGEGAILIRV